MLAVGQAMEVAKGLGVPPTSCLHDPGFLGTRGIAERPRVSGLGHCVDEGTEPRKREEPHLGVTQRAWGSTI